MTGKGENYYMDEAGELIPHSNYTANVIVATGSVTQDYARRYLVPFGVMLRDDPFWNHQIQQINVLTDGGIELSPRVGDHLIFLGHPDDLDRKLSRLKRFYD